MKIDNPSTNKPIKKNRQNKIKKVKTERAVRSIRGRIETLLVVSKNPPEFKPGKTPWLQYGKEILNGNTDWVKKTNDILNAGYGCKSLARRMDLSEAEIQKVSNGDISPLDFKLGARLLTIEEEVFPDLIKY